MAHVAWLGPACVNTCERWLHNVNTATHRRRRPWRECVMTVIGAFAAAAVRQWLGRASLRRDARH